MPSKTLPHGLTGVAGEYLVAGELSRRGYIASITLRNTRGIDILVSNADATRQIGIQVKARQGHRPEWVLNEKAESFASETLFYVFVNLKDLTERPDFYIVPSKVVADFVRNDHRTWLDTPGKRGQVHKDNPVRQFRDPEKKFLERWDVLGL